MIGCIEKELKVIQDDKIYSTIKNKLTKYCEYWVKRKHQWQIAIDRFYELIWRIYEEEMILKDFRKNKIMIILKKVKMDRCKYYKIVNLLSHSSKVLARYNA